jgi:hypothetical protein
MIRPGGKAEMMARVVPSTFRNGFYAGLIVALFLGLWLAPTLVGGKTGAPPQQTSPSANRKP